MNACTENCIELHHTRSVVDDFACYIIESFHGDYFF